MAAVLGATSRIFFDEPLAAWKIHGELPIFPMLNTGNGNCYGIGVYDLADIRCNRA